MSHEIYGKGGGPMFEINSTVIILVIIAIELALIYVKLGKQ